jgi:hypothetical protein
MKRLMRLSRERGMTLLESLLALMAWISLTTLCALVLKHHSRQSAALIPEKRPAAPLPDLINAPDQLLYRQKIPSYPHYQQMKTDLDLQQHAIVFGASQQQDTLSAEGLQFQHTTPEETHRASIALTVQDTKTAYPLLTLENSKQYRAQISASAVQMSAPSLFTRHHQFSYDTVNKKLTVICSHPHEGLQWHRQWHQLPYHHLPYHHPQTKEDLQQAAQTICEYDSQPTHSKQSPLYRHLGRMFMVGNVDQQHSTVFICGKSTSSLGSSPQAYPLFSSPLPRQENTTAPLPPIEKAEKKEVVGLIFHDRNDLHQLDKLDSHKKYQLYFFLVDTIEKILFFLEVENTISKAYERQNQKYDELKSFIQAIEKHKKDITTLDGVKKENYLKTLIESYEKLSATYFDHNQDKNSGWLINYFLHRSVEKTCQEKTGDTAFLKNLLTQLKGCQQEQSQSSIDLLFKEYYKKGLNHQKLDTVIQNSNVKTFLLQCLEFKKILHYRWMQTVYVLSSAEYSGKDPVYELKLTDLPLNEGSP